MLSWLQVKLNSFILSCICSLLIHSIVILILVFCGSYTQLKHTHLYPSSSDVLSSTKQLTPVRLGKIPHITDKAQISVPAESSLQNISEILVEQQVEYTTCAAPESKPVPVQEHEQKQVQQAIVPASKKSTAQNKKTVNNKQTHKQVPAPGQFSLLKKEHTTLLSSKKRQKSRVQAKKEPAKKQAEKHRASVNGATNGNTQVVHSLKNTKDRAQEQVSKANTNSTNSVTTAHDKTSVQAPTQASQIVHTRERDQYTSSKTFASLEQIKAYESVTNKIGNNYSKPPGFDNSLPFTLTFKVSHVTGKPHDISPRPGQVPLLVYQSAKASITEMVYPQELWGTELAILFN